MKVKTEELRLLCDIFTKVIKEDKVRPITTLIEFNNGTIGMTDNNTRIKANLGYEEEPITAVLDVQELFKLVKLTTKDTMSFKMFDDYVEIKGNGKYKFAIKEDQGNPIILNLNMPDIDDMHEIDVDVIKKVLQRNKLSLYTGESNPEFGKYYSEDNHIVTSNGNSIAILNGSLFEQELLPSVIEQVNNLGDKLLYAKTENGYYVKTDKIKYYTKEFKRDPFPSEVVMPFVDIKNNTDMFTGNIVINKSELVSALKRLSSFKNVYGIPTFKLTLNNEYAILYNTQGKAEEHLNVNSFKVGDEVNVVLEIETVLKFLRVMEEEITIYCGNGQPIIFEDSLGSFILEQFEEE